MQPGCLWTDGKKGTAIGGAALPSETDVAIVGGGYTGLAAARAIARAGKSVVIIEKETIGFGASSRNGGFVLPGFKEDLDVLIARYGRARAMALYQESLAAIGFLEDLISRESISCDFHRSGHVTLAETAKQFRALENSARLLGSYGQPCSILDSRSIRNEVGSSLYRGGLLDPAAAQVQPARLLSGMTRAALSAGATLVEGAEVRNIGSRNGQTLVETSRGTVQAGAVIVATNGYSRAAHPELCSRIVPIGSHIIATVPLIASVAKSLLPTGRIVNDSRNLLHYYRLSADGRLVFGGRASFTPTSEARTESILRHDMVRIFPELAQTLIEYAWSGFVGFTRDQMPHIERLGDAWCAGGYCGHGVAMSVFLGDRLGQHVATGAELPELATLDFPKIPLYHGDPWFLPIVGGWYRMRDWIDQ
ncbi:MAG: FAD-binding oxidoreductase [Gemmatimonadota bacterium]